MLLGSRPRRRFRHQDTVFSHARPQLSMFCRIRNIKTGSNHTRRSTRHVVRCIQHTDVGVGINPSRQPRHHAHAKFCEFATPPPCQPSSTLGRMTRPDDGDTTLVQHTQIPAHEQHRRCHRVVRQRRWITLVSMNDNRDTRGLVSVRNLTQSQWRNVRPQPTKVIGKRRHNRVSVNHAMQHVLRVSCCNQTSQSSWCLARQRSKRGRGNRARSRRCARAHCCVRAHRRSMTDVKSTRIAEAASTCSRVIGPSCAARSAMVRATLRTR